MKQVLQSYRVFIVASHHLNSGVIYYVNKVLIKCSKMWKITWLEWSVFYLVNVALSWWNLPQNLNLWSDKLQKIMQVIIESSRKVQFSLSMATNCTFLLVNVDGRHRPLHFIRSTAGCTFRHAQILEDLKLKLSRGEICVANLKAPLRMVWVWVVNKNGLLPNGPKWADPENFLIRII